MKWYSIWNKENVLQSLEGSCKENKQIYQEPKTAYSQYSSIVSSVEVTPTKLYGEMSPVMICAIEIACR